MMMPRIRDPERTRSKLLESAFTEIWEKGYGGASVEDILAKCDVTKGALYHHFPSKKALGLAVLNEVVREGIVQTWMEPLTESDDPIQTMRNVFAAHRDEMSDEEIALGCPLNNCAQEMAAVDEDFRRDVERAYELWHSVLADAFRRGQDKGTVRSDIDPDSTATFIIAASEGMAGLAKAAQSRIVVRNGCASMDLFLDSLKP